MMGTNCKSFINIYIWGPQHITYHYVVFGLLIINILRDNWRYLGAQRSFVLKAPVRRDTTEAAKASSRPNA